MTEVLIEARGLDVWFDRDDGPFHAVKGLDLTLRAGERRALVGESGCGKSTSLHALMGLLPASATVGGEIAICGDDVLSGGERGFQPHRWTDVAMVFQGAMNAMNPVSTVGGQIEEVLALRAGVRGAEARARVEELLELVALPATTAGRHPHQLSGGMRQRACIAMALACRPKVLLADEPTTALDAIVAADVAAMLSRLCDDLGLALLLVSHDLGLACETCDQVSVMQHGVVVEAGKPGDLVADPQHAHTEMLFTSVLDLSDARIEQAPEPVVTESVLDVDDLVVEYAPSRTAWKRDRTPVRAVAGVSLSVRRGQFVALIGESGSGKTSVAQSIIRMVSAQDGRIRVAGRDVGSASTGELRQIRRSVQMIFQDPYGSLDPRMTVRQIVAEPLDIHGVAGGRAAQEREIVAALTACGLTPPATYLDRFPHQLSGGERQRVALASAIVVKPELLIADEPVSMLDVSLRAGILQLLDTLRRDSGLTLLMITHDIATALRHADVVVVMHAGRIVESGPTHTIVRAPQHAYTKALLAAVPSRTAATDPSISTARTVGS